MIKKQPARILNVTLSLIFVLFFTFWYILRVYSSILNWQVLSQYGANPVYICLTGLFWFLSGLVLLILLWKRHIYAIRAGLSIAGLYTLWYWVDRLFIQTSPAPNLVFSAWFSAGLLILFSFTLITSPA